MLFKTDAEKAFGVETYLSPEMDNAIKLWGQLESGKPPWVEGDTRTIRFSNTVARELAKLVTQNIDIKVQAKYGGGETAGRIQKAIDDYFLKNAQEIMQNVIMLGGVMAKWNGKGMDYIPPDRFLVTGFDSNGEVTGAIFFSYYQKEKKFYTRAEWHRWEDTTRRDESGESVAVRIYRVSNKAFVSDQQDQIGRETSLKNTKWADIVPEFTAENLEKPLFVYIKNPYSNTIDSDSPLGVSCFSECIEELRWLDIAMSTMGTETETSAPMMMVDQSVVQYADMNGIKLPKFIMSGGNIDMSNGTGSPVEQWQPTLQVASRTEGINFYLNIISAKVGLDVGYYVFNGQRVIAATATQIESAERRTVNTVLAYRQVLDRPESNGDGRVGVIHDMAYIIDSMFVINGEYSTSEYGNYEIFCDFADIVANKQEDMMLDLQLANQGFMSKAAFLVLHRGYTVEEAKKMVEDARKENEAKQEGSLFGEE